MTQTGAASRPSPQPRRRVGRGPDMQQAAQVCPRPQPRAARRGRGPGLAGAAPDVSVATTDFSSVARAGEPRPGRATVEAVLAHRPDSRAASATVAMARSGGTDAAPACRGQVRPRPWRAPSRRTRAQARRGLAPARPRRDLARRADEPPGASVGAATAGHGQQCPASARPTQARAQWKRKRLLRPVTLRHFATIADRLCARLSSRGHNGIWQRWLAPSVPPQSTSPPSHFSARSGVEGEMASEAKDVGILAMVIYFLPNCVIEEGLPRQEKQGYEGLGSYIGEVPGVAPKRQRSRVGTAR